MKAKSKNRSNTSGKKAKKTTISNKAKRTGGVKNEVISIIILIFAVFLWVSLFKYGNIPDGTEFIGIIGTNLVYGLHFLFGEGAVITSYFLLCWSIHIGIKNSLWSGRMWGLSLLTLTILVYISLYNIPEGLDAWNAGLKGLGGGIVGGGLAYLLLGLAGEVGGLLFLVSGIMLSAVLVINKPMREIFAIFVQVLAKIRNALSALLWEDIGEENLDKKVSKQDESFTSDPVIINHNGTKEKEEDLIRLPVLNEAEDEDISWDNNQGDSVKNELKLGIHKDNRDLNYQKPPLEILSYINAEKSIDKKNIKQSIAVLEDTFRNFGINVKVNQVSCGPSVTRYELTPAPGVRVSKIISLTDDLQLNLAAPGIRIEAPIPGKSAVGIEIPNSKIMSVGLRNLLSSAAFQRLNTPLAYALGEDISGNVMVAKLDDMPHLLIAGSTGSGKSVCINSIIMSMLFNSTPEELKMVFIDPKMVELTVYNGIPHLMAPVVTDPKKASLILKWMVTEMEKRYKVFAQKGVRDIHRYNQVSDDKLPYIVIIIDELADLMMVAPVEVEDSICRLAQMARAAGMHLIVATQRPSVDVVTGVIKANIPSRIAFAVSSQADSRTILDTGGAEKLLGKGDMLFLPVGAVKPYRVQGTFVSDAEIEQTIKFIKEQAGGYQESEEARELEISLEQMEEDCEDDLFWDAVTVFVENRKASVSLLQRRLRVGYARAARLVDLMEDRGIVSELDNNKKRDILINEDQLRQLRDRSNMN